MPRGITRATEAKTLTPPGPIYVFLPEGFDPKSYLPEELRGCSDPVRFMVHKIICGSVFNRDEKGGFVNIPAESMRAFFPNNAAYRKAKDCLIAGGAIITDNHYVVGGKSRGYILSERFSTMRHKRAAITNHRLARKIVRSRHERSMSFTGVYRHLFENLLDIEIDHDAALALLRHQGDYCPDNETAIRLIEGKQFHFVVCPYGRVHTNVTNLKSSLRQFLSVRGEPLVNLDVRNSQPLIFAAILAGFYRAAGDGNSVLPPDVEKYVELVQAGRFYEHLMDEAGIGNDERKAFKERFFGSTFFCKNDPVKPDAAIFAGLFPSVYALIREKKADDYTALAKELQRTESSIVIGGVANRCMVELPYAFVATVHDSVLTTEKYAKIIQGFMMEEFAKVGLDPTINAEPA